MSRDVFVSLSGASSSWRHLEVLAENLSNVSTQGYKEHRVAFSLWENPDDPIGKSYARIDAETRDFSDGPILRDGNDTHLALQGKGFFLASTGAAPTLVRSGAFNLDADGYLVTASGARIQGEGGDIRIPEDTGFHVDEDGTILDDQGYEIDRIRVVWGDNPQPAGDGQWKVTGELREAEGIRMVQGALEGSNTNPVRCMVELIENSRLFEMYQKAIQTSENMDGQINAMESR